MRTTSIPGPFSLVVGAGAQQRLQEGPRKAVGGQPLHLLASPVIAQHSGRQLFQQRRVVCPLGSATAAFTALPTAAAKLCGQSAAAPRASRGGCLSSLSAAGSGLRLCCRLLARRRCHIAACQHAQQPPRHKRAACQGGSGGMHAIQRWCVQLGAHNQQLQPQRASPQPSVTAGYRACLLIAMDWKGGGSPILAGGHFVQRGRASLRHGGQRLQRKPALRVGQVTDAQPELSSGSSSSNSSSSGSNSSSSGSNSGSSGSGGGSSSSSSKVRSAISSSSSLLQGGMPRAFQAALA